MHKPDLSGLKRPPSHRALLIAAMRDLALTKGLPATSVDEVCVVAGVTKGSFYHHFASKDELGLAALKSYYDDVLAALREGSWAEAADPYDRLAGFVTHAAGVCDGPLMAQGCLLGNFSLDMADGDPDVRELVSAMFAELRDVVAGLVAGAAADRGVVVDAGHLGDQFLAVLEGSNVLAKAHADRGARGRGVAFFGDHLALLLDPKRI